MTCVTATSFWFSSAGVTCMMFAWAAPFWLSYQEHSVANHYQGLWYHVDCFAQECTLFRHIMDNNNVELAIRDWDIDIVVVPALVTVALIFGILAVVVLELLICKCSRKTLNMKALKVIIFCMIILFISVILAATGMFIMYYIASEFYSQYDRDAFLFPWCLLAITLGVVLIVIGLIMYLIIVCNWYDYSDHYDGWRNEDDSMDAVHPLAARNTSSFKRSFRHSGRETTKSNGVGAFSNPALGLSSSAYALGGSADFRKSKSTFGSPLAKSSSAYAAPLTRSSSAYGRMNQSKSAYGASKMKDDVYFDFRLSKYSRSGNDLRFSKKTNNDLAHSRKSLNDSPRILRNTTINDYAKSQSEYLNRIREPRGEDEIDPMRLSTGRTAYRESNEQKFSSYSGLSGSKSEPKFASSENEPTVLDILYRESKKDNAYF